MKWIALAILLAGVVPFGTWLRANPRAVPIMWTLIGFLPFGTGTFHLYMAVISWAGWPGYVKGAEVSLLDFLAVAVYLSLRRHGRVPFLLPMALYLATVVLSAAHAAVPMAALFYAWQFARMGLVYFVTAQASADDRVAPAILTGMALGLGMEACVSIWERFALGVLQAGGTLGHENFLGLMSHFVTFPWIALLLAGVRGWRPILAPIAGVLTAALTVSRGTVGLVAIGFVMLFSLSAWRHWSPRKAHVLMGSVALALLVAPLVLASFQTRFHEESASNYDERAAFEKAATMMISDHPWGVGANNYVVVANTQGYNNRARVAEVIGSDSANVHNIYYLVTAETGYVGLAAFILMLLQPLILAFRCAFKHHRDPRADLILGIGVALLMVYVHSYFEWIFITFQGQYMFVLEAGMVAGLVRQLRGQPAFNLSPDRPAPQSALAPAALVGN